MRLVIGHTPDADDAYMFYGMVSGNVDTRGLELVHDLQELQVLNQMARDGVHEITAMSFYAYGELYPKYRPLGPGVSYGHGYGPRIIARQPYHLAELRKGTLAIPGRRTTAALLAREFGWQGEFLELPYKETPSAVDDGRAVAALIIHEEQLLFQEKGFSLVQDLGAWWAEQNKGLPLPLGVNVVRRDIPEDVARRYAAVFHDSIRYGLEHREDALAYSMQFAREANLDVARQFVGMYVNESTLDISADALESVRRLLRLMPAGADIPADFIQAG